MTEHIKPPEGYDTWLDYAVATMDTREAFLEGIESGWWGNATPQREVMRKSALAELAALRSRAAQGDG